MDLLSPIIGDTAARIVILAAALLLIAALTLLLVGVALRIFRGGGFGFRGSRNRAPRLSVTDVMPVDSRRKLILVRRDTVEHLLLVGGAADLVIEQSIQRSAQPAARGRAAATNGAQSAAPPQPQPAAPAGPPPAAQAAPLEPSQPAPQPAQTIGRLGIPAPPGRIGGARPTATETRPADAEAPAAAEGAPTAPPAVAGLAPGLAMPPRSAGGRVPATPRRPTNRAAAPGNGSPVLPAEPGGAEDPMAAASEPTAVGLPSAASGGDDRIEKEIAALMPALAVERRSEQPKSAHELAAVESESSGDPADRAGGERLTKSEAEMAHLLSEIFGKK